MYVCYKYIRLYIYRYTLYIKVWKVQLHVSNLPMLYMCSCDFGNFPASRALTWHFEIHNDVC